MSDSTASFPSTRFRLGTLGTLALVAPSGETILGKHGHHRRRLALLAVLAAAGEQGRSRDQLLLLFWPDATQARARHSLDQLLYALRASIGETVFTGVNPVALNAHVIDSDVTAFNAALARGDLEAAVDEYRGPFLDGLYLTDAPEFEQWVDGERARLATAYTDALTQLAQEAEAERDYATAVRRWRRLTETDPVSSNHAIGLIRALMNAGDHPAALQFAERYEAIVAQELGTTVGPAVASLVAEVRAEIQTESVSPPKPLPVGTSRRATHWSPSIEPIADRLPSAGRAVGRRFSWYAGGALLLATAVAVTAVLFTRTNGTAKEPPTESSIAVLPFVNLSGDANDASLVDGLTEELTGALSRIESLRTIARTSAFALRNSGLDARQIGDSLGVDFVLEGSVQKSAPRLRVQLRLIDARSGTMRWANTYDRPLADVFAIQSDIAAAVARELDLRLGSGSVQRLSRPVTRNIAAYELYQRGRDPVHLRSVTGPPRGLALLQQAVALDPTFAAAHAQMAYMYFGHTSSAISTDSILKYKRLARAAAERALALDSLLPEAHAALAVSLAMNPPHLDSAEAVLRRALALGAGPRVREHLSRVLMWSGRYAESLIEAQRAASDDPLSPSAAADVAEGLCTNGRIDEGLAQLDLVTTVVPPLRRASAYRGLCYALKGAWPEAIMALRADSGRRGDILLMFALARGGDAADVRRTQTALRETWRRTGNGSMDLAAMAAALGNRDEAFEWLDRAARDGSLSTLITYPLFAELHNDPRFDRVREHLGIQKR